MTPLVSLENQRGLVIGIANEQSIAYGCAKAYRAAGASLAITYLNAKAEPHVRPLAEQLESPLILPCDVQAPGELEAVFDRIGQSWGRLDFLLHAIAFAPRQDLQGRVTDCSREGFLLAMDISCHSFIRMARLAEPLMKEGGSLATLTFYGGEKVVENYHLMGPVKAALERVVSYLAQELGGKGIRVNAISPGPIVTRAASGLKDFDQMQAQVYGRLPGRQPVRIDDVGGLAAFLASDGGRKISGENIHVDCGYHVLG